MLEANISQIIKKVIHLDTIFGKWIVLLLLLIYAYGSINFYQLNKRVSKITPKVLSSKLKHLQEIDLIWRKILIEQPLRVEYYITRKGEEFVENLIKTFNLKCILPKKN